MTLTTIKEYLKINSTDEDFLLTSLISAAEGFIQQTTGKTQVKTGVDESGVTTYAAISTDELYNTCVKMLVAQWFENRGVQATTQLNDFSFSGQKLINHIAMCGVYA